MSTQATVRGVDVSNNEGAKDWAALYREGVRFAYSRVTEGLHLVDDAAPGHLAGARVHGIHTGGYHFAWPNESAVLQAAHYITRARPFAEADPHFVHWLDLEPYSDGRNYQGMSAVEICAWAGEWLSIVARAFPHQRVGVYAGGPEWDAGHVPSEPWLTYWFPEYPFRGMTFAEAAARPRPRAGRHFAGIWQFSGTPDLNLYYGTEAEYLAWTAPTPVHPPVPVPKPIPAPKPPKPPVHQRLRVWVVKRGQTLSLIAAAFGVSVAALASFNHISNPDLIYPNERVTAPPSPTHHTPVPSVSPSPSVSTSPYTHPSPHPSTPRTCG